MPDSLLAWYERELTLLWEGARHFAEQHPQQAQSLGISYDTVDDPHVARVMESFALLTARMARQAARESGKISIDLLQVVFPLCVQPLPSVSMIRVAPDIDQSSVKTLPQGTRFRAYIDDDRYCQFRTTRQLELCPFDIVSTHIERRPFGRDNIPCPELAVAMLGLDLAMIDESRRFNELADDYGLTIYFRGPARLQTLMYDLLCRDLCRILLVDRQGSYHELPLTSFAPVGFGEGDRLLSQEHTFFSDYQMVTELLSLPELFFGFRLNGIGTQLQQFDSREVSLLFCLENMPDEMLLGADQLRFLLGCAPLVNLFDHIAEPVVVDHRQLDYPLIPDSYSPNTVEIQAVTEVLDITGEQPVVLPPLYGLKHNDGEHHCFWLHRPVDVDTGRYGHLEISHTDMDPGRNQVMVLSPHVTCSNGNQVLDLPANPGLECLDNIILPTDVRLLMRPTAPVARKLDIQTRLNLLVLLSENIVSIFQARDPARQFRNLLSMYAQRKTTTGVAWLESMSAIRVEPQVAQIRIDGHQCLLQGSEVVFELDPIKLKQSSIMMFSNLLDYLAVRFAGFHSFIQVVIQLKGHQGEYIRCTRRHGYQINR
ncbi:type VI secretion system baseplate subunit TssF [Endozoicomonas sp. ALC013]|uniref:type VI secretion system baseplate subunit TssF n=1 Tax=Endozoicomonas sp. ALC013 TaxID=3403076 RepID=UPI003BB5A675